jgi:hypothetical protein
MAEFGLQGEIKNAREQGTAQDQANFQQYRDWRVVLRLAPESSGYLYKAPNPGILAPLALTDGVIFPYTPQVAVQYSASYDPTEVAHSNYKIFQYRSSSVDTVSITGDFTAQDTFEANYVIAVIHFFRSITKMFYGQDQNPRNGTPPPLCYLYGLGAFQFNKHPLAITGFNYSLPNDVDYIRSNISSQENPDSILGQWSDNPSNTRTASAGISPGGVPMPPQWALSQVNSGGSGSDGPTYVPTKMQIQINAVPIISRRDISENFSLEQYASGRLLLGSNRPQSGGVW